MIGVLDSGMAGLMLVKEIREKFPGYDTFFFGDTARSPYDGKSRDNIEAFTLEGAEFLVRQGAKLLIPADPSAAAFALDSLQERFAIPVLDPIHLLVQAALQTTRKNKIGLVAPPAAISAGVYESKLRSLSPIARLHTKSCPLLEPLITSGWLQKPETVMIVKKCLHPLKTRQIDTLILGALSYTCLQKIMARKLGKNVSLVDPLTASLKGLQAFLQENPEIAQKLPQNGQMRIFVSDAAPHFQKTAPFFFKGHVNLEVVHRRNGPNTTVWSRRAGGG